MSTIDTTDKTNSALSNAEDVAKFFIQYYRNNHMLITNPMLSKLLYFAQGHCLIEHNRSLFNEKIEAWESGPVVPVIYEKYKGFGNMGLIEPEYSIVNYGDLFDSDTIALIVLVARQYRRYSDWGLTQIYYEQQYVGKFGMWDEAFIEDEKHVPITNADIKIYFKDVELGEFEEEEELSEETIKRIEAYEKAEKDGTLVTYTSEEMRKFCGLSD